MAPNKAEATATPDALPLVGIKVLDFSRHLPGPWCTQLLGDMGAEVIKVERAGEGDPSRHNAPRYRNESVYFCSVNGNKRAVSLDLATPEGQARAHALIKDADILVESFRVGVAAKLGVDWPQVRTINPRLIYCSITGFGREGPLSGIPGHDLAIQAVSGQLGNGTTGMPSFQAADYAAGAMASIAILAALRRRDSAGEGAFLDIGMLDSLLAMGNIALTSAMARGAGADGLPHMEVWGGNPRYNLYPTRDGKQVAVGLLEAGIWKKFCTAIGRPDAVFADEASSDRLTHHGERSAIYEEVISGYCLAHDRDAIAAQMLALNLPVMPVLTPDEALASDNVKARGLVGEVTHPTEGRTLTLRTPLDRAGLTRGDRSPAPPHAEPEAGRSAAARWGMQ